MKHRLPAQNLPKSRRQMADEYHIHVRTFRRRIIQENIKLPPGLIMPRDQQRIYRAFGPPPSVWTPDGFIPFDSE